MIDLRLRFGMVRFPSPDAVHIMIGHRALCHRAVTELRPEQETGLGSRHVCQRCVTEHDALRAVAQMSRATSLAPRLVKRVSGKPIRIAERRP